MYLLGFFGEVELTYSPVNLKTCFPVAFRIDPDSGQDADVTGWLFSLYIDTVAIRKIYFALIARGSKDIHYFRSELLHVLGWRGSVFLENKH